jgi:hypothetical protein
MKPLIATVAGVLGLGGLLVAGGARPFAAKTEPVPTPAASTTGAQPVAGATAVDCGEGRRALVRTIEGATSIQCVDAPLVGIPLASSYDGMVPNAIPLSPAAVYEDTIAPAARPIRVASAPVYRTRSAPARRVVRPGRTWKKSAAIIGGATAAGAGVGAVLDGGSGAKKGAVVGLLGGTIYDIATRNR